MNFSRTGSSASSDIPLAAIAAGLVTVGAALFFFAPSLLDRIRAKTDFGRATPPKADYDPSDYYDAVGGQGAEVLSDDDSNRGAV